MSHRVNGCGASPIGGIIAVLLAHKGNTMQVNEEKTHVVEGVGANKLQIVIDGADRADVEGRVAKDLARMESSKRGFGAGGMCDQPVIGPVGPDGEMLEGEDALNPSIPVQGFRVEYMFAMRA